MEDYKPEPKFKIGDIVAILDEREMIPTKFTISSMYYYQPKKDSFYYQPRGCWYYEMESEKPLRKYITRRESEIILYSDLENADGEINYSALCYYKLCELVDMKNGYELKPSFPIELLKNMHKKGGRL